MVILSSGPRAHFAADAESGARSILKGNATKMQQLVVQTGI
jgi:hypothetical protein